MGPSGPIELDMSIVIKVCGLFGIDDNDVVLDVWDRLGTLSHALLKACRDDAERKAKQAKLKGKPHG